MEHPHGETHVMRGGSLEDVLSSTVHQQNHGGTPADGGREEVRGKGGQDEDGFTHYKKCKEQLPPEKFRLFRLQRRKRRRKKKRRGTERAGAVTGPNWRTGFCGQCSGGGQEVLRWRTGTCSSSLHIYVTKLHLNIISCCHLSSFFTPFSSNAARGQAEAPANALAVLMRRRHASGRQQPDVDPFKVNMTVGRRGRGGGPVWKNRLLQALARIRLLFLLATRATAHP